VPILSLFLCMDMCCGAVRQSLHHLHMESRILINDDLTIYLFSNNIYTAAGNSAHNYIYISLSTETSLSDIFTALMDVMKIFTENTLSKEQKWKYALQFGVYRVSKCILVHSASLIIADTNLFCSQILPCTEV
jgi:hypothetical protein